MIVVDIDNVVVVVTEVLAEVILIAVETVVVITIVLVEVILIVVEIDDFVVAVTNTSWK